MRSDKWNALNVCTWGWERKRLPLSSASFNYEICNKIGHELAFVTWSSRRGHSATGAWAVEEPARQDLHPLHPAVAARIRSGRWGGERRSTPGSLLPFHLCTGASYWLNQMAGHPGFWHLRTSAPRGTEQDRECEEWIQRGRITRPDPTFNNLTPSISVFS